MERTKGITGGIGKVGLALLAGATMPILIWVALGVAINQKVRERRAVRQPAPTIGEILAAAGLSFNEDIATAKPVAAKVFMQQSVKDIGSVLAAAGLSIHEEDAPTHCWEILHCPPERQKACPAHARREIPSWVAIGLGQRGQVRDVCVNCNLLDLKTLPTRA
ncbi:MAG: hypothetical protein HY665_01715 [Chloroflexi bacterium]|nr:hypothetical protein [Chloroflexota bacterium]